MIKCNGYIDSVYSGSAVDGTGLRVVVFFSGCNMACPFCHNPETLFKKGEEISAEALAKRIKRYASYIKHGGVTLSGGEPCLQSDFAICLIKLLAIDGIKVAIETNGSIINERLISLSEYLICDVKNQTNDNISQYKQFLSACKKCGKKVELTCVIVPSVNDTQEKLQQLRHLKNEFSDTVTGIRLLPFKKLCVDKYQKLGKVFPYNDKEECSKQNIEDCYKIINA